MVILAKKLTVRLVRDTLHPSMTGRLLGGDMIYCWAKYPACNRFTVY